MIGSSLGFRPFELFKGCIPQLHTEIIKDEETGGSRPVEESGEGRVFPSFHLRGLRRHHDPVGNGDTVEHL